MMKKFVLVLAIVMIFAIPSCIYAGFSDVEENAYYSEAINRVADLGIISGFSDGTYKPNEYVTREQFAKALVVASGLEGTANSLKGIKIFPDVDPDSWSCGYINVALHAGYISAKDDGNFHPSENITFAEACTSLIRTLGYLDKDLPGIWPNNYISKAEALGLIKNFNLTADDPLPRWALAYMLDALMDANIKDKNVTFAQEHGIFTECIVLANSKTMDTLTSAQVLTDKGTYYIKDSVKNIELGNKYGFVIEKDTIIKAYDRTTDIEKITVKNILGNRITYYQGNSLKTMNLPNKTTYYYKGEKVSNFSNLQNIIKVNSSIIFAYNSDKTGYLYAIIEDPVYSKPEIAGEVGENVKSIGSIKIADNSVIIKNGEAIKASEIEKYDVVYEVSDIWNQNKYIYVVDDKVEGTLTGILPNVLSPKTIQIGNNSYEISQDMSVEKIIGMMDNLKVGNYITLILGYDEKIVDVLYSGMVQPSNYAFVLDTSSTFTSDINGNVKTIYYVKLFMSDGKTATFETDADASEFIGQSIKYVKNGDNSISLSNISVIDAPVEQLFSDDKGLYTECSVIGNSMISNTISANEVLTDKGLLKLHNGNMTLELGVKYKVIINGDTIIKVIRSLNTVENITVENVVETTIKAKNIRSQMVLPDKITYYYNGTKINYDTLKSILNVNTALIMAYNEKGTEYAYAIVIDPIYSKPEIAVNFDYVTKKIGSINLSDYPPIIKNGEMIMISDLKDLDVVYEVTDIWGNNRYILVVDDRVDGKITGILPNKLSPKAIQVDGKNYDLSTYMNLDKINNTYGAFGIGDQIVALLGNDGKVVDIIYPGVEDTSGFAFVINTSETSSTRIEDLGKPIYYAKLLLPNGVVKTYQSVEDVRSQKGTLVKYKVVESENEAETVLITPCSYISAHEAHAIDKYERTMDSSFVTDNVKIYNVISVPESGDAQVELLDWSEMPNGTIMAGKLLYVNRTGLFDDINLMVFNDLFDDKYKYAVIKESILEGKTRQYTLLIDGKEYKYNSEIVVGSGLEGAVLKVEMENNSIKRIVQSGVSECQSSRIQAIDTKRIKVDDKIYVFKDNVAIYLKDKEGKVKLIGTKDIDISKFYGRVSVYLDKWYLLGGKVEVIVIEE